MRSHWRKSALVAGLGLASLALAACDPGGGGGEDCDGGYDGGGYDGGGYDGGGWGGGGWGGGDWGGDDLQVVGYTNSNQLVCFETDDPDDVDVIGTVTGLTGGDTRLVGTDFRNANGLLYGLGNAGGVYTLNTSNAQATFVSRLNVALSGTNFGVDFNPVVDRLRVVSDNGQNLRVNVADGTTIVDGTLTYPGPPAMTATGVTGAAYTNNDTSADTATTLYDIDSMLDQVVIQSPANAGSLAATGKLTVDTGPTVGFDIYSEVDNGKTVDLQSYASLVVNGQYALYEITLFNGEADFEDDFDGFQVVDIAIPLNQL